MNCSAAVDEPASRRASNNNGKLTWRIWSFYRSVTRLCRLIGLMGHQEDNLQSWTSNVRCWQYTILLGICHVARSLIWPVSSLDPDRCERGETSSLQQYYSQTTSHHRTKTVDYESRGTNDIKAQKQEARDAATEHAAVTMRSI